VAFPSGLRQLARPEAAVACVGCGELAGRGYPECADCEERVERYWVADWLAVLDEESVAPEDLVGTVLADVTWRYPWTCVDWALRLSECPDCGAELATGDPGCVGCAIADDKRWAREHDISTGPAARVSGNERALRTARVVLRAPARYRTTVVLHWRLVLPFLLTGELAGFERNHWLRAALISGRYDELSTRRHYADLVDAPRVPWHDVD
jgi:hypothetical protein